MYHAVPQGSILGQLQFILFDNSMYDIISLTISVHLSLSPSNVKTYIKLHWLAVRSDTQILKVPDNMGES